MGLLQLFNVADTKAMVRGATAGSAESSFSIPAFIQGDTPSIEYTLLRSNGLRQQPTKISPGTYDLAIGLYTNDATSTQLAFQSTWANDVVNNRKSGTLTFHSGNMTTAIGTAALITVRMVCKVTIDGLDETVFDSEVTLKRRRIPSPATTIPAGEVAATVSFCNGTFAPLFDCPGIVFRDPDTGARTFVGPPDFVARPYTE